MSDSDGKVKFGFELTQDASNPHVKFSGIRIRNCKNDSSGKNEVKTAY